MCGIVGFTGKNEAKERLLSGLRRLEYRGYDSAGISVFDEQQSIATYKTMGRIQNLQQLVEGKADAATCGIGHTRWATHGVPSDINAHPHSTPKLSLVHNGIIENYLQLREYLSGKGYTFETQTDTEIAAKLIDYYYDGDPVASINKATEELEGSYAFAIMFYDHVGELYATRKDSPLVVTKSDDGLFVASDMPAVLNYTNHYYTLETGEVARLAESETFYDKNGNEIQKDINVSDLTFEQSEKDGYEHYMLKEIYEQPRALERTLLPRISPKGMPDFKADGLKNSFFEDIKHIHIVACGTAYYSGSIGSQIVRRLANINATPHVASEFRYGPPMFSKGDLVMAISQSGETADTLAALKLAKSQGVKTLAIVNVKGSAIANEADYVLYTHAGPEIAVASTKAFTVQVALFYLFAIELAYRKDQMTKDVTKEHVAELLSTVSSLADTFKHNDECLEVAKTFLDAQSMFYIGRGLDANLSLEGALKLKEISYIHCEAYAAGELKHGTISLITEQTPIIAIVTDKTLVQKTISNMKEVKARGGKVTAITLSDIEIPDDSCDNKVVIDSKYPFFAPLQVIVPLQLLAYHTACLKGCDVDKPRNLAKSVTVE